MLLLNKYLLFLSFSMIFINSCSFSNSFEKSFNNIKNSKFFIKKSQCILMNFNTAAEKIILEILKYKNIIDNNTLLFINPLRNETSILINKDKLTNIIKSQFLKNSQKIILVQKKNIDEAKKAIGLSNDKDLTNTNTAILLARHNNAQYYLHSCIFLKNKKFLLNMQLILVKTGEIVFSKAETFYW